MALRDSWQQQRQQRQKELAMRQQAVQAMLAMAQKERQETASLLRTDLGLFRESLTQADEVRLVKAQERKVNLQIDRRQRINDVQTFLEDASDRRQAQSQQVAEELEAFGQSLQQSTAEFLALTGAEHELMALQLFRDLQVFRKALRRKGETLHQTLKIDIKTLQTETQLFLYQIQQEKLQTQIRLSKDLTAFTDNLHIEVQNYLIELSASRQNRTETVTEMLEQSRTERLAKVKALFKQFAAFRSHLRAYRTNLFNLVESDGMGEMLAANPTAPQVIVQPKPTKSEPSKSTPATPEPLVVRSQGLQSPTFKAPVITPPATQPTARFGKIKSVARPFAKSSVKEAIVPQPENQLIDIDALSQIFGAFSKEDSLAMTSVPSLASTQSSAIEAIPAAADILQYLHKVEGARLTEIESVLGISRFQTVDALRALIRAGAITQRDRLYVLRA